MTLVRIRIRLQNLKSRFQNLNLDFTLKCNPSPTCHPCHPTIMDTSLETLAFLGHFPVYTGPTPPLTPQTKLDEQVFFSVSTFYRVGWGGGGELQENFKKDAPFYEGTQT